MGKTGKHSKPPGNEKAQEKVLFSEEEAEIEKSLKSFGYPG
jgi:hypothetical protein